MDVIPDARDNGYIEIVCLDGILEIPYYVLNVTMLYKLVRDGKLITTINIKTSVLNEFFEILVKIEETNYVPDVYECQRYYKISLHVGYNRFTHQIMRRLNTELSMFSLEFVERFASDRPDVIHHLVNRISYDSMYNYRYYPLCVIKEVMANQLGKTIINNIRECNEINLFISLWRLYEQTHFNNYVDKTFKKKWKQYYFPQLESIVSNLTPKMIQINTYDYIEHWTRSPDGSYVHENVIYPNLRMVIQKYKSITINTLPARVIIVDTNQVIW